MNHIINLLNRNNNNKFFFIKFKFNYLLIIFHEPNSDQLFCLIWGISSSQSLEAVAFSFKHAWKKYMAWEVRKLDGLGHSF